MYIASMHFPFALHCRFRHASMYFLVFAGALLLAVSTPAQQISASHDMSGMLPLTPPEQLPTPVHMTGIGNAHIGITATPEAQIWFDQGLNLLHDFWEYESMKAFQQGLRVDPDCAMCWWGLAQAEQARGKDLESYAK